MKGVEVVATMIWEVFSSFLRRRYHSVTSTLNIFGKFLNVSFPTACTKLRRSRIAITIILDRMSGAVRTKRSRLAAARGRLGTVMGVYIIDGVLVMVVVVMLVV